MSTGTGSTRREKQAQTRRALLDAAAQLFGEHGLEGTSVDRIATAAGYTKGAFYANFAAKEELFLVMLEERFALLHRERVRLAGGAEHGETCAPLRQEPPAVAGEARPVRRKVRTERREHRRHDAADASAFRWRCGRLL